MKITLSDYGYSILMIETKSVCNMHCRFCPYPIMDSKGSELSNEEVFRIIDSIDPSDSRLEGIYFEKYNEPLLDNRLFGFVEYAKGKGFRVQVITNGLLLGSKDIRTRLLEAEPTRILISLQVINKNTFSDSRGIPYSFEKYKEGIFAFLDEALRRDSPSLITIDVACNFLTDSAIFSKTGKVSRIFGLERGDPSVPNELSDIEQDLLEFLRDLHRHNPAFEYDQEKIRQFLKTIDQNYVTQEGLQISKNIFVKIKQFIYGRKLTEFYPVSQSLGCTTTMLSIDAKGAVSPCCLAYDDMLTLGNIKEEPLKKILDKRKKFIEGIRSGDRLPRICRICIGQPTRRGSIIASAYWGARRLLRRY